MGKTKRKERVMVFEGEDKFLVPRNRTYDMQRGISTFVNGSGGTDGGVNSGCGVYVLQGGATEGSWTATSCEGTGLGGTIQAGSTTITPCVISASLSLMNVSVLSNTPCQSSATSSTNTTPIPEPLITTTTTTTTTVAPTGAAIVTLPAGSTIGIPPAGGGGGGGGGTDTATPEAKKSIWPYILIGLGILYVLTRKKKK